MGESCTIKPHVRNKQGEVVESKLFNDLLHYTSDDRELSKDYYAVGTNEGFLAKAKEDDNYREDENGEITFTSLRTLAGLDIDTDQLLKVLNKDFGEGTYDYDTAVEKVKEFNNTNDYRDKMLATMAPSRGQKYYVYIVPRSRVVTDNNGRKKTVSDGGEEQKKLHDVVRNKEVETRIKALLRNHKVSVKFIEDDSKGGRYSTENADRMIEGMYGLIEVNENNYTTEVLAEEAGHFAVGALGDSPLVKRLEGLLESPSVQREALGEEDYKSASLGENPAREVAGRLVGKALLRKLSPNSSINVLANRVANLAKRVFYKISGNDVRWAVAKAEQIANEIAYNFEQGNPEFSVDKARSIIEIMNDATPSMNVRTYKEIIDELGRACKQLEAIADDTFAGQVDASRGWSIIAGIEGSSGKSALQFSNENIKDMADLLSSRGIVQSIVQIVDYFGSGKQLERMMDAVDLTKPSDFYQNMARNGRYLRQVRTFIKSAEIITTTIMARLHDDSFGGKLQFFDSTSIHDVRYQDEAGNWRSIDLENVLDAMTRAIIHYRRRLSNLESAYFAEFCKDVYGDNYVTTTTGVLWKDIFRGTNAEGEHEISIDDMIKGDGIDDIDILHRFLGSMSNNPDIVGQIIDKMMKSANKQADDQAFEYKERLAILRERAKALGLDVADLVERDKKGVPTGNMIMPPASPTQHGNDEEDFIYEAYMKEIEKPDSGFDEVPAICYSRWEEDRENKTNELWNTFKKNHPNWRSMSGYTRGELWDKFRKKEMKRWNKANSILVEVKDGEGNIKYVRWVPNLTYATDAWDKLTEKYKKEPGATDSLAQWVNDYLEIKKQLDSMLPQGATMLHRLPQFKGTFMNSLRNQKLLDKGIGVRAWRNTAGRRLVLDSFVQTAEDEMFGSMNTMNNPEEELLGSRLNYEEERALRIPVFGINKLTHLQDLDTDLFHSMYAYAAMATSYNSVSNVVDALEVGRQVLYDRKIEGKNTVIDKGVHAVGNTFRKMSGAHETFAEGSKNRAYGRYLKFLERQVYGISATHWGIPIWFGKRLLLSKFANNISSLGGSLFLKWNILGGAVNTGTGVVNIFREAFAGGEISMEGWLYANGYYFEHFFPMWSTDFGSLDKNNKLSLFLERMNTQGDSKTKAREWRTTRSRLNNAYRMLGYLPYSSGDHYMQAISYLSVAHDTKLHDTISHARENLWEAFETDEIEAYDRKSTKTKAIKFKKMCPLATNDITAEQLLTVGAYLKVPDKGKNSFEKWLVFYYPEFSDPIYKGNHADEYNDYRSQFNKMSEEELMEYTYDKYNVLLGVLEKAEKYVSSPILAPAFTSAELDYIRSLGVGTGNYKDIIQLTKNDIFNIIWTKADESAFMDRCREVNNGLHGIYNQQDKTAFHQAWYTNAFLAMKGWALGLLEKMYSPAHHSIALNKEVEGYVNTALKIPASVIMGYIHDMQDRRNLKRKEDKEKEHPGTIVEYLAYNHQHMSIGDLLITMFCPWFGRSKEAMLKAGFTEEQHVNAKRFVASLAVMAGLLMLRVATAPPDKDEEDEEMSTAEGLVYYLSMRMLLEQEALIYLPEMYVQTGQLMDFMPVGFSAMYDLYTLVFDEGLGALTGDKDAFYQRNDRNGRYEKDEAKFWNHLIRISPIKSKWGLEHPAEAAENYEFGRKLRTR